MRTFTEGISCGILGGHHQQLVGLVSCLLDTAFFALTGSCDVMPIARHCSLASSSPQNASSSQGAETEKCEFRSTIATEKV